MNVLRPAVMHIGAANGDAEAARRLATWLLCCLAMTLLLTVCSLIVGTSSIETSIGWILAPDAQS